MNKIHVICLLVICLLCLGTAASHGDDLARDPDAVLLHFENTDIKSVLRSIGKYGGKTIVCSQDVKGSVTITIKDVPWRKALDSVLVNYNLVMQEAGNIILVMTLEQKLNNDRAKLIEAERKRVADKKYNERRLKQTEKKQAANYEHVLFKVRIVEMPGDYIQELGVQWVHSDSQEKSNAGGLMAGIVIGNTREYVERQLKRLESSGAGQVIYETSVMAINNMGSVIVQQGKHIYTTAIFDKSSVSRVLPDNANFGLGFTPRISGEDQMTIEINTVMPPKKKLDKKILLYSGDMAVIGGILNVPDYKGEVEAMRYLVVFIAPSIF